MVLQTTKNYRHTIVCPGSGPVGVSCTGKI
jgi:hypothetical protein